MNPSQIVSDAKSKFGVSVDHFMAELKKLRTGRAHPSMLDSVMVEAYGTQMPLSQSATITAVDAQLLQITPFDPSNLQAIASAIRNNPTLGLNPADDGHVVRVPIPPLTEERRHDLVRVVGQKQEDCMVVLRSLRHDTMDAINRAKKDKQIGEDDANRLNKQIEEAMGKARLEVESLAKSKEQELITV